MKSVEDLVTKLKRLAEKATQGKWWIDSHGSSMVSFHDDKDMDTIFVTDPNMGPAVRHVSTGNLSHWKNDVDATYIATACPQNILKILSAMGVLRSGANAWRQVDNFVKDHLPEHAAGLRDKVSQELHEANCQSAPTHLICFIKALIEENEDLREELAIKEMESWRSYAEE